MGAICIRLPLGAAVIPTFHVRWLALRSGTTEQKKAYQHQTRQELQRFHFASPFVHGLGSPQGSA
jgi:hypothetical protein